MSYAAQRVEYPDRHEVNVNLDPLIVRAAKQVYRYYRDSYAAQLPRPLGVAIDRRTMEGKLVYKQVLLLPQETFVSIDLIEAGDFH